MRSMFRFGIAGWVGVFLALTAVVAQAQVVSTSPTSLNFGTQQVGFPTASQSVTVTNTGTAVLTFTSIKLVGANTKDYAPLSHNCSAGVRPGLSCTITVTFTPQAAGTRIASINLADNAPDTPQSVSLTGVGGTPAASFSPTSLSFESQNVGTTSAAQSVTLTNTGTAPMGIPSVAASGDFAQTNNCPVSLGINANCAISVTFTPSTSGTRTGSISVTDTAAGSPQSVGLTGTGAAILPVVSFSPASLGFANQLVGTSSATQLVTMTNIGTVFLNVTSLALSGTNAGDFAPLTHNCGTGLAAGANCTIMLKFTPSAAGLRSAFVTVTDNAGNSPQNYSVSGTGISLTSIAVTPATASVGAGLKQQFTATATFSDGTTQDYTPTASWSSSNGVVASVTGGGLASGLTQGTASITASTNGVSGSATLTVLAPTLTSIAVTPTPASFALGQNQQFTATGTYSDSTTQNITSTVTWTSSNPAITLTSAGVASATATGAATITATQGSVSGNASLTVNAAALTSIAVTPSSASILGVGTQQLTATGTYTDGTTQNITSTATWASSTPTTATVSASGLVTGVAAASGTATITASANGVSGTVYGTSTITVTAATLQTISLSPSTTSIAKGQTVQFTATGTYNDGSGRDITTIVTWTSGNLAYFTVNASGLVTSLTTGTSFVTATQGSVTTSATVVVIQKALTTITVSPANPSVAKGVTQQFTATGLYTDNSSQNISSQVTWSSSNPAVATANFSGSTPTLSQGTATITALQGSVTGSTTLTVTAATLSSISVTPVSPSVIVGATQQFTATGVYTDASTQTMTSTATWTSSATKTATIVAGGLATSKAVGTTTITATSGTIKGNTVLTVNAVGAITVTVSPRNASVTISQTQQFTATVTGNSNTAVTWFVDGVAGGNATAGTISATGLYSPPTVTGAHVVTATSQANTAVSASSNMYTTTFPGMFVYKYDQLRTGQNLAEPALTTTNVNTSTFGKLFSCAVDGPIYGQPLYYANLSIAGGIHNVIYVVTMNDSAYAFDADSSACQVLWQQNYLQSGEIPLPLTDINPSCGEVPQLNIGIIGTPVIDTTSGKMYFLVATRNNSIQSAPTYHHRIYAVDILTGNVLAGPTEIAASVAGTGEASVGGTLTFDPKMHKARPALTLANGVVYTGFGGDCDTHPYHGWLFGFDANTLAMTNVMSTSANGEGDGVWMGGGGFSVDANGNMFLVSGDGTFDGNVGGSAWGDSFLRLQPFNGSFNILDSFTPANQAALDSGNNDLGAAGLLLLPDQPGNYPHLAVSGGKDSVLHLVNRDQMGGYNAGFDNNLQNITLPQKLKVTPSYWNGNVYVGARTDSVRQYQVTISVSGQPSLTQVQVTSVAPGYPGTAPVIAAASPTATSGVAFFLNNTNYANGVAYLYAVDASNVSKQLWISTQAANSRDALHNAVKYTIPTIANGKVYVGTQGFVDVFGLLP